MKLGFYNHAVLNEYNANTVARIQMACAFAKIQNISSIDFVYFRTPDSLQNIATKLSDYKKINVIPENIKMYTDPGVKKLTLGMKCKNIISIIYICLRYILKFIFQEARTDTLTYIRGISFLFAMTVSSFVKSHKFCFELHNYEFGSNDILDLFYKLAFKKAAFAITISRHTRDLWIKNGIEPAKILVVPSGVNHTYSAKAENPELIQNIAQQRAIIYTGRIGANRGIEDLIYCAAHMPNNQFYFIGGPPDEIAKYKTYCQNRYGKISNIYWIGHIQNTQIPLYLEAAKVLVAPYSKNISTVEHMSPIKVLEYLGANKPIVVSDLPTIREIVSEKEVYFFEPDNQQNLVEVIEQALNDPRAADKAKTAFEKSKEYSWDKRVEKIMAKFEQAA